VRPTTGGRVTGRDTSRRCCPPTGCSRQPRSARCGPSVMLEVDGVPRSALEALVQASYPHAQQNPDAGAYGRPLHHDTGQRDRLRLRSDCVTRSAAGGGRHPARRWVIPGRSGRWARLWPYLEFTSCTICTFSPSRPRPKGMNVALCTSYCAECHIHVADKYGLCCWCLAVVSSPDRCGGILGDSRAFQPGSRRQTTVVPFSCRW
jgi:hypothetical protein